MDAGVVTGAFTLAGTVSGLIVGLVAEYQREKWARERDTKAHQARRQEERARFQRTALMDLQADPSEAHRGARGRLEPANVDQEETHEST